MCFKFYEDRNANVSAKDLFIWTISLVPQDVFISQIGYLAFNILYFVTPEGTLHHHLM